MLCVYACMHICVYACIYVFMHVHVMLLTDIQNFDNEALSNMSVESGAHVVAATAQTHAESSAHVVAGTTQSVVFT